MNFYQYNVFTKETFNATGKAKGDVIKILNNMGINDLYHPSRYRVVRIIQQYIALKKFKRANDNVLIIQYPAVVDSFIDSASKKCEMIAIIHDLQSIRGTKTTDEEIKLLNKFSVVISHNKKMTNYLLKNGLKSKVVDLDIFDYLSEKVNHYNNLNDGDISFAGNLNKSEFVTKLSEIHDINFLLYGIVDDPEKFNKSKNIKYLGSLPSDEIVSKLKGTFGLVWDGDSVDTCSGNLGKYLMYNNPHKLSLYMAAGKPVIVWENSAIADFVEQERIGITVSSLKEAAALVNDFSPDDYEMLHDNVENIRKKVTSGFYMEKAITNATNLILGEN